MKIYWLLDIGLLRSTLNIYNQKIKINKNIPLGSQHHKDISYIMKLNLKDSEKIKQLFNKSETDFSYSDQENTQEKY